MVGWIAADKRISTGNDDDDKSDDVKWMMRFIEGVNKMKMIKKGFKECNHMNE